MSQHGASSVFKRRALGIGFVVMVLAGCTLSYAGYAHWFDDYTTVTLKTDKVGNQLGLKADVKARGVIVGYVSDIEPSASGANLKLNLYPDKAKLVPANTSARLLPKTLFGERYVALQFTNTDGPKLASGDVIPQDKTKAAIELSKLFDNLLPVLQAVQPEKLNSTLSAISGALQGRGKQLGETLKNLSHYMADLSPHVPELQKVLKELPRFANTIDAAAPDLAQALDNLRTPSKTLVEKQNDLMTLYGSTQKGVGDLKTYLEQNKNNLITVNKISKRTLKLLAKFAPEIPCVTQQYTRATPGLEHYFGKGEKNPSLNINTVLGLPSMPKYQPNRDEPQNGYIGGKDANGKDWGKYEGPWCADALNPKLPNPFPYPFKMIRAQNGAKQLPDPKSSLDGKPMPCDAITVYGNKVPKAWTDSCAPGTKPDGAGITHGELDDHSGGLEPTGSGSGGGGDSGGTINTPQENQLLSVIESTQTGQDASKLPNWGSYLVGPLYRGTAVNLGG